MMRLALISSLVLFASLLIGFGAPAHAADRDCGDFNTQKAAQIFFLKQGGPKKDPHRLDAEGDGIACESNPCPCYKKKTLPGDGGGGGNGGGGSGGGKTVRQGAKVIKVIDGDTVRVRLNSGGQRDVRMIGIDTPEVYGGTECGGPEASENLKGLLPKGQRVTLISDPTQDLKDRYDRLLRYVIKPNGLDTNRNQLRAGWARLYVYDNTPFKRVGPYRSARDDAKASDRGIWSLC